MARRLPLRDGRICCCGRACEPEASGKVTVRAAVEEGAGDAVKLGCMQCRLLLVLVRPARGFAITNRSVGT